jgi:COMPASS component SWD1
VARKLRGHMRQVQSLSWSTGDRYLLSASLDWKAILWDLQTGEQLRTVRFEAPIFIAELQPSNQYVLSCHGDSCSDGSFSFVAALFENKPVLVDIAEEEPSIKTLPTAPKRPPADRDADTEKQAAQDAKQTTTVTKFSPSGEYIFSGTNKGWLNIIDAKSCATLSSYRISSSMIILLRFTNAGKDLVVNSSDRIIRTFRLPDFSNPGFDFDTFHLDTPLRFQDLVNKLSWNHVCFSPSGEHVVASPYMNHSIYIWDRDSDRGSLVKILEAPDEISVVEVPLPLPLSAPR